MAACGFAPVPKDAASFGYPNKGCLLRAAALPTSGPGFARAKAGDDTRWGTRELVDLIERSAASVSRAHPGTAPLYVGDLSAAQGGQHSLHGSHRTGRDVDLLFYLLDMRGRSVRGRGFYAFDARGVSVIEGDAASEIDSDARNPAFFDTARNWALVRALVMDDEVPVQWIFCADSIKARLLSYAALHESDPRVLLRASYVLHQPSYGRIHDDHFHVRIACRARDRSLLCLDPGPVWPWFRDQHEKPEWLDFRDDDATLVTALLGE